VQPACPPWGQLSASVGARAAATWTRAPRTRPATVR